MLGWFLYLPAFLKVPSLQSSWQQMTITGVMSYEDNRSSRAFSQNTLNWLLWFLTMYLFLQDVVYKTNDRIYCQCFIIWPAPQTTTLHLLFLGEMLNILLRSSSCDVGRCCKLGHIPCSWHEGYWVLAMWWAACGYYIVIHWKFFIIRHI
jgi:hypothetical protein